MFNTMELPSIWTWEGQMARTTRISDPKVQHEINQKRAFGYAPGLPAGSPANKSSSSSSSSGSPNSSPTKHLRLFNGKNRNPICPSNDPDAPDSILQKYKQYGSMQIRRQTADEKKVDEKAIAALRQALETLVRSIHPNHGNIIPILLRDLLSLNSASDRALLPCQPQSRQLLATPKTGTYFFAVIPPTEQLSPQCIKMLRNKIGKARRLRAHELAVAGDLDVKILWKREFKFDDKRNASWAPDIWSRNDIFEVREAAKAMYHESRDSTEFASWDVVMPQESLRALEAVLEQKGYQLNIVENITATALAPAELEELNMYYHDLAHERTQSPTPPCSPLRKFEFSKSQLDFEFDRIRTEHEVSARRLRLRATSGASPAGHHQLPAESVEHTARLGRLQERLRVPPTREFPGTPWANMKAKGRIRKAKTERAAWERNLTEQAEHHREQNHVLSLAETISDKTKGKKPVQQPHGPADENTNYHADANSSSPRSSPTRSKAAGKLPIQHPQNRPADTEKNLEQLSQTDSPTASKSNQNENADWESESEPEPKVEPQKKRPGMHRRTSSKKSIKSVNSGKAGAGRVSRKVKFTIG